MTKLNYNERSWVIDLISEINLISSNKKSLKFKATGEQTLSTELGKLFPDLILQDENLNVIQGWECKFPDTSILDKDLLLNAKIKAESLNLQSFLVWNVKEASLYIKNNNSNQFEVVKSWFTKNINSREDVFINTEEWKKTLIEIITDLGDYFKTGEIKTTFITEVISSSFLNELIEHSYKNDISVIKDKEKNSSLFRSQFEDWWEFNKNSFGNNKYEAISKISFLKWINKIIFANTLNSYVNIDNEIQSINNIKSVNELINIFKQITEDHNFLNIFSSEFLDEMLSIESLSSLQILNQLMYSNKLTDDIKRLYIYLIENNISDTNKKFHGFFTTPEKLANLLVDLVIDNTDGYAIDPCCGSGTIVKSLRDFYEEYSDPVSVNKKIWGSDKFDFPVQISTISNVKPELIGNILNIFQEDAFNLEPKKEIKFVNPNEPTVPVLKQLPEFDYVISNLPFVSFNKINEYSKMKDIGKLNIKNFNSDYNIGARSDLYFYLIVHLKNILKQKGKAGFITSNSWLGTKEGDNFKTLLLENFNIETIVISGQGKWFENADIKTLLLILSKDTENKTTKFVTLNKNISKFSADEIKKVKNNILLSQHSELANVYVREKEEFLDLASSIGSSWMPFFVDISWINQSFIDKLIPLDSIFTISRGIRKGWNEMFYVSSSTDIEEEYLSPLYRSSAEYNRLEIEPSKREVAFDCNENLEYLSKNKPNAYSWIKQFETKTNTSGKLLPESLGKPNNWYKLSQTPFADFMISQNPYKKLLVFKPSKKGIIDQRFICLTIKKPGEHNNDLLHILLNSLIFQFFLEATGFGRGLGALDINSKNVSAMKFLNPKLLSEKQIQKLLKLFEPLKNREQENLEYEVLKQDRIEFEEYLLHCFGFNFSYENVKKSLTSLYKIRIGE